MSILQMNIYGSILIIFTVIIRAAAMNKLPKKTFIALTLYIHADIKPRCPRKTVILIYG